MSYSHYFLPVRGYTSFSPTCRASPPPCCLGCPSRPEEAVLEGSEAKEKRAGFSRAAWACSARGLSQCSVLNLTGRFTLLFPREPLGQPGAWVWLPGHLFRHGLVPAQRPHVPRSPFHGAQPAAEDVALPQPLPGLSRDPIFHITGLPSSPYGSFTSMFSKRNSSLCSARSATWQTETQSIWGSGALFPLSACSAGTWVFPPSPWLPP